MSRKFITTASAMLTGILVLIFGNGEIASVISGCLITGISAVVYCFVEGAIDKNAISGIIDSSIELLEESKDILKGNGQND